MKISMVVTTKNDEKNANLLKALDKMSSLDAEIIVVDWGSEVPVQLPWFVKGLYVSPDIASKYDRDSKFALNIAFNVGIRRSTGDFIFYMGNDTFCTKNLLDYVSKRCNVDTFYVVGRRHVDSPETMSDFRQSKVSTRWGAGGGGVAHRNIWHTLRGFDQKWIYYGLIDREIVWRSQLAGFNVRILPYEVSLYHIVHPKCYMRTHGMGNEDLYTPEQIQPLSHVVNDENWGLWDESIKTT